MNFRLALKQPATRQSVNLVGIVLAVAVAAFLVTNDWLGAAGVIVLWAGWQFLPNIGGPPMLQLAFTHQWVQVFLGVYYHGVTGRKLEAIEMSDYRPMVMIGMGCLVALLVGLVVGVKLFNRAFKTETELLAESLSLRVLVIGYAVSFAVVGGVSALAWQIPGFTQAIISLSFLRLALLFLLLRKLVWPKLQTPWIVLILSLEVVIGITGFFAGFREPLAIATIVLLERFNAKSFRHWAVFGGMAAAALFLAVLWTAVKVDYRSKFVSDEAFANSTETRLSYIGAALGKFVSGEGGQVADQMDALVDRLWVVYYPALAVSRVPKELPHTDGEILQSALLHVVTPRFLFPEKAGLRSDSEMVRKYSGIWVAGGDDGTNAENDTSIAFGYAAESYLDFGVPWMFVPVLIWGVVMGLLYGLFFRLIVHRELAIAVGTVIFWLSLYIFERSWVKTLGQSATLIVYLTVVTVLVDRFLLSQKSSSTISVVRRMAIG
ncbi:MAG: hypothetical protein SF097_01920 [Acidobacteriota bacterium]|nr:hypothetical protein [Acidobacteriota bacterium]